MTGYNTQPHLKSGSFITRRHVAVLLVTVIGIVFSLLAFFRNLQWENERIQSDLREVGKSRVFDLERSIAQYITIVESLEGFYYSSEEVTRTEFRTFVRKIIDRYPHIHALEWIQRIPDSQREFYEEKAREEGFPDFNFNERTPEGKKIISPRRDVYFPVYYVEPYKGNEEALGYDMGSEPTRLEGLVRARYSGEITASSRIRLVQEPEGSFAFLMFIPIYKKNAVPDQTNRQGDSFLGLVLGVSQIDKLVDHALKNHNTDEIDVYIFDASARENEKFLCYYPSLNESAPSVAVKDPDVLSDNLYYSSKIAIADRQWLFIAKPTENFIKSRQTVMPWMILIGGMILTALMITYILAIQKTVIQARVFAEEQSRSRDEMEKAYVELKRIDNELRESNEKHERLVNNLVGSFLYRHNVNGAFSYVSSSITRVLGYTIDEFLTDFDSYYTRHPVNQEARRHTELSIKGIPQDPHEIQIYHKDGSMHWVEVSEVPVFDENNNVIAVEGVAHDVTERRLLEEQLRQSQKMEAVGKLAGGVAHDFNNILQAILGYCELALDNDKNGQSSKDELNEIRKASNRATALVRQLLAFSRRQMLKLEDLFLDEVVKDIINMLSRVIGEDIVLNVFFAPELGLVHADRGQIQQVLMNLCVNARDAMPDGGEINIRIQNVAIGKDYCRERSWAKPGQYVMISISDTGSGMDSETQTHLFEPFFTTKETGKGTGLGLATVYGIIKQHDGMIDAFSEKGKGTEFKIYLPMVKGTVVASTANGAAVPIGGSETILLAEDDEGVRTLAGNILKKAGYNVLTAENGEGALKLFELQGDEIDLAFLDVVMPRMGGHAVSLKIREKRPDLPVLFASGYSPDMIHSNFILNEDIEFLQKPYLQNDLLLKIREVLDKAASGETSDK